MSEEQGIFLGLGSNLGNRYENLKLGIGKLNSHPHIWVKDKSHVYKSPAMYYTDQEEYFNMVIEIETNLIPLDLLNVVKRIEQEVGRKNNNNQRNMPRVLDVDILAYGCLQIKSKLLEIPHLRLSERRFVLKPWNDIAPTFKVPGQNAIVSQILKNTKDNSEVRMVLILDKKGMV